MINKETTNLLLSETERILAQAKPLETCLQAVMHLLHDRLNHYHWVGIYWLQGDTLVLGPYVGPPTEHTHIPVGRGVCGTAVAQNANRIIEDVRRLDNYLACNLETRSEIVVLLRDSEEGIVGQIDVDGTETGGFDESDELFLEEIGKRIVQATSFSK
jgi:L-methionine (R)-S-oxide reductase